jgi:stage III sporulation protein AB
MFTAVLKAVGSALILAASVGFPYRLHRERILHIEQLGEIRSLLLSLEAEETLFRQPMELLLQRQAIPLSRPLREICETMRGELAGKQGKSGEKIWSDVVRENRGDLLLSQEESELFARAGGALFGKSVEENRRQLSYLIGQLEEQIRTRRQEKREKQRVYGTVSLMGGMILILVLL